LKSQLCIPSDLKYLGDIKNFVNEILKYCKIPLYDGMNIHLSISECINNAIYHGNKQDLNKLVTIFAECRDGYLVFEISDEGEGFDYSDLPDPTSSVNIRKEGGRGLFIIRNLVDQISFKNNGSVIQLKFKLDRGHQFLL